MPSRARHRAARRASRAADEQPRSARRRPPRGRLVRHPPAPRPASSRPAEPRAPSLPSRVSSSPEPLGLRHRLFPAGHGLAHATARPRVRARALASGRQALAVTETAIAADLLEPFDVQRDLAAEVALHRIAAIDDLADLGDLGLGEIADARGEIDPRLLEDLARRRRPDAVDVAQGDVHSLLAWDVNTRDTGHATPAAACALARSRSRGSAARAG